MECTGDSLSGTPSPGLVRAMFAGLAQGGASRQAVAAAAAAVVRCSYGASPTSLGRRPSSSPLNQAEEVLNAARESRPGLQHAGDLTRMLRAGGEHALAKQVRQVTSARNIAAHPVEGLVPAVRAAVKRLGAASGGTGTTGERASAPALVSASVEDDTGAVMQSADLDAADELRGTDPIGDSGSSSVEDGSDAHEVGVAYTQTAVSMCNTMIIPSHCKVAFAEAVTLATEGDEELRQTVHMATGDTGEASGVPGLLARIDELTARLDGMDAVVARAVEQAVEQQTRACQAALDERVLSLEARLDEVGKLTAALRETVVSVGSTAMGAEKAISELSHGLPDLLTRAVAPLGDKVASQAEQLDKLCSDFKKIERQADVVGKIATEAAHRSATACERLAAVADAALL